MSSGDYSIRTCPAMFEDLIDAYDAMIDWPKRLANESDFYRWVFQRVGAATVLDAACGTGQHAAMFHSWGLRVEGADQSPAMIERCRLRYGEPDGLRWAMRGFEQLNQCERAPHINSPAEGARISDMGRRHYPKYTSAHADEQANALRYRAEPSIMNLAPRVCFYLAQGGTRHVVKRVSTQPL